MEWIGLRETKYYILSLESNCWLTFWWVGKHGYYTSNRQCRKGRTNWVEDDEEPPDGGNPWSEEERSRSSTREEEVKPCMWPPSRVRRPAQLANKKDYRRIQRTLSAESESARVKETLPHLRMRRSQTQKKTRHPNRRRKKSVFHSLKSNIHSCLSVYMSICWDIVVLNLSAACCESYMATKNDEKQLWEEEYRSILRIQKRS